MGTITGSLASMIGDILINEEPDIPERYLCVGLCLWRFDILYMYANFYVGGDDTKFVSALSVFLARIIAVKYHISVPVLKGEE